MTVSYIDSSRGLHLGCRCEDVLLLRCPANVLGVGAPSSLADRCHSLRSLLPPPAALPSLPIAGPVIVYGVSASIVYGLIYWVFTKI